MESLAVLSLLDLCYIRVAYLLVCLNMEKTWFVNWFIASLEFPPDFLSDLQTLPLPESLTLYLKSYMKLVAGFLPSLLGSWFPNDNLAVSRGFIPGYVLYECLVLKSDGLIDQRKTAAKLLRGRMFDNFFAFRLACMNFLEEEVLQLWIHVKEFFVNRLMYDAYFYRPCEQYPFDVDEAIYPHLSRLNDLPLHPCTTEPHEVLFWIGYCLAKANVTDLMEVPHFAGGNVSWYEFSLDSAAYFGNVACFDYFSNFRHYNDREIIRKILLSKNNRQQSSFLFHFKRLSMEEKANLFSRFPKGLVSHFLEWPLSLEFMKNYKSLWNMIPERYKVWTFLKIFAILFYKFDETGNMSIVFRNWRRFHLYSASTIKGIYSLDHLRSIWIKLWKKSSDSYKLRFLNTVVLKSIERSSKSRKFCSKFKLYGMEQKLRKLFISKGEAVLELYECVNLKESLINLVSKYLKEDFEMLHRNCISFLANDKKQLVSAENRLERKHKVIHCFSEYSPRIILNRVHMHFLNYLKDNLFSLL